MILNIEKLRVYYQTLRGPVKATDDVSFSVADGEILGIAGESGCGKSTLCNSLILLKPPMKYIDGRVSIEGHDLPIYNYEKMRKFRYQKISIIPQYAMDALNPIRRIGPMINDLLACHGKTIDSLKEVLLQRLTMVNLSHQTLTMYPFELSGGMKQRLVMVIATLLNPSLLICDEITSALDVSSQRAVIELTKEFITQKIVKGILFITHDLSVLYQGAHSIMIMYAAKVVERASTETILQQPLHPYTRLLISSLPEIGIRYDEKKLSSIPGKPPSLLNPPHGCRFKTRCPEANPRCDEEPELKELHEGHFVACWRRLEERV
ncbi:MAG: ABC transporter ATP-binding protein [Chitinivibrionales bacterium]|nr:ABC transporter ATP-binding protein [Chitinivibrionales bacterium]